MFENKILIRHIYHVVSHELDKNISYVIPVLRSKIRIDIVAKDDICADYIKNKRINILLQYENNPINLMDLNNLERGNKVLIEIKKSENILNDCRMNLEIIDPYGNAAKFFFLILIPTLIIFYILFKISWLLLAAKIRNRK